MGLSVQLRCPCCVVVLVTGGLFETDFLIPIDFVSPAQKQIRREKPIREVPLL